MIDFFFKSLVILQFLIKRKQIQYLDTKKYSTNRENEFEETNQTYC